MKLLWNYPGWGWKMYGLARLSRRPMWFVGFSIQAREKPDA